MPASHAKVPGTIIARTSTTAFFMLAFETSCLKAAKDIRTELSAKVIKRYGGVKKGLEVSLRAI